MNWFRDEGERLRFPVVYPQFPTRSDSKATEMYRVYKAFAEAINVDPVGQKRITDQLREYETLKSSISIGRATVILKGVFTTLTAGSCEPHPTVGRP